MVYNPLQSNTYWSDIDTYMDTIPTNIVKIRRKDNGEISQDNETPSNNIIGKWAIAKKNGSGGGEKLHDCCTHRNIACRYARSISGDNDPSNLATWTST